MIFTAIDPILIRKVRDPYGWLSNMAPFPITFSPDLGGERWKTAEALFQATRFSRDAMGVRRQIREALSPVTAKRIAERHAKDHAKDLIVKRHTPEDSEALHLVLLMKLHEHPELLTTLLETGDRHIIEDCSDRIHGSALYWGAARVPDAPDTWHGQNQLGALWMRIRASKRATTPNHHQDGFDNDNEKD